MRNVLVTGGSRGIGLAIAREARGRGLQRHRGGAARERRIARGDRRGASRAICISAPVDLSAIDAIPAFVKSLRDEFGPIYGLVNNAGIGTEGLLATMHNSDIEALVRLNVLSPVILTKYVVRHMMADGEGRIVNISSIIASTGYNGLSVYGATKAAATGFTRSLAREVGKVGITVNAIAPGFIDTELTQGLGGEGRDKIAKRSALRRLPEVGRRRAHGGISLQRRRPQHHRQRADHRRRQHRLIVVADPLSRYFSCLGRSMRCSANSGGPSINLRIRRSRSSSGSDGSSNVLIRPIASSSIVHASCCTA